MLRLKLVVCALHVGHVTIEGYFQQEETVQELYEDPQAPSYEDTNFFSKQGKNRCISICV
jgi:hypothetical protein